MENNKIPVFGELVSGIKNQYVTEAAQIRNLAELLDKIRRRDVISAKVENGLINFCNGDNETVFSITSASFIKDGLFDDVKIEKDFLIFTFKGVEANEPIKLSIRDIFNLDNFNITKITHAELKSLRDLGELIPGHQYRITDYETIVSKSKSAGHLFDILVTATDSRTLCEWASALHHDGDTYFKNNNLTSWKIKYSLDNDISRFEWAYFSGDAVSQGTKYTYSHENDKIIHDIYYYAFVSSNGDIVYSTSRNPTNRDIVYMYENDYFEGWVMVQAGRFTTPSAGGKGVIYYMQDEFGNEAPYDFKNITQQATVTIEPCNIVKDEYYYTFSLVLDDGTITDHSLNAQCRGNVIGLRHDGLLRLPMVIINNTAILSECSNNKINNSSEIYMGGGCNRNRIDALCNNIVLQGSCADNRIGNQCSAITFGQGCERNTLSDKCNSITLGLLCNDNNFYGQDNDISVGNMSSYNVFEKAASLIILGKNCLFNHFGSYCNNIRFFISDTTSADYCWNNKFASGTKNIYICPTEGPSLKNKLQNIRTHPGKYPENIYYIHAIVNLPEPLHIYCKNGVPISCYGYGIVPNAERSYDVFSGDGWKSMQELFCTLNIAIFNNFEYEVDERNITTSSTSLTEHNIVWLPEYGIFADKVRQDDGTYMYHKGWSDLSGYMTGVDDAATPLQGVIYLCGSKKYIFNGTSLIEYKKS